MAMVLSTVNTPYDVACFVRCILHGIHGHTTRGWNAPLGPKGSKHTLHQQSDSMHLAIFPGWTNSFSLAIKWDERLLYNDQPSLTSNSYFIMFALPLFLWCSRSNIALPSPQYVMDAGRTILPLLALSKKTREHLMFSQPSDECAMCMAIAFWASLRHFSLLTELKAQFNHNGVISGFGSLFSTRHSSISLNRIIASFNTRLMYSSSTVGTWKINF